VLFAHGVLCVFVAVHSLLLLLNLWPVHVACCQSLCLFFYCLLYFFIVMFHYYKTFDELFASLAARCCVCYYIRMPLVFFYFMHGDKLIWWWWWVNLWLFALIFALQQYIAPVMSIFGPLNNPTNAYNNYRVYGTILCFLMFVCVFIGVKFVSKFSPVALLCVIFSIACVYIGIFVANPDRGPKYVFDLFLALIAGIWCVKSLT